MRDIILLVNNSPSKSLVCKEVLISLEVDIINAISIESTSAQLYKNKISLIILDIQSPVINGYSILKSIRKNNKWRDIPIIFISEVDISNINQIKNIELGAIDFMVKPVVPKLLYEKIKTFLELFHYRNNQNIKSPKVSQDLEKLMSDRVQQLELKNKQLQAEQKERKAAINIINASPAVAFRWKNVEGLPLEYVSENVEEISGYSVDELISGKINILDIIHPDDLERVNNELFKFSRDKHKSTFTHKPYRILKKNGDILWVDERLLFLRNDEGNITHFQGILVDITNKVLAELELAISLKSLRESEDLFRTLSDASFESIFISRDGKCVMQNKTAEKMFGYTLNEAFGKLGTAWIVPEDRELVIKNIKNDSLGPYNVTAIRKDGTTFPCEIKARISTYKGKSIRITSLTDISKRVEARKQLIESEKQYRSLIQNNHSIIMVFEPEFGKIIEVNNACCSFYGYSRDKMLRMSVYEINILSKKEINVEIQNALTNKKNYFVFKHKLANSKVCDVEIYAGKIEYGDKEVILSVIHDITEKVKTSKELIIAKEKAIESDRLKTAFLANMSHEIRTPMNAILGFSQLLKIPGIKIDETNSYVDTINNSGHQLLRLIDDIISISQIEAGIIDINISNISIDKILKTIFNLFSLKAENKGLSFSYKIELPKKHQTISTDAKRLQQILINLISNALKFTHEGKVEFGCLLNNNKIEFYVSDTGIGISEADKKIIFDRFMQVDHGKDVFYGGTGIGLSISKAIVEKLNGKIWIAPKKTKGSEFRFSIPAIKHATNKDVSENKEKDIEIDLHGKTILIAEDEEFNYEFLNVILINAGAKTYRANNGKEVIDIVNNKYDIDLILMDIKMPVLNGLEATRLLRRSNNNIPIIAQTAYALVGDRDKIIKAGCDDYIPKPIQKDKLFTVIGKYI